MRDLSNLQGVRVLARGLDGGSFTARSPTDAKLELRVIASHGLGWDHVSVSLPHRCPNWTEMGHVKRLFFEEGETAMQLHVPQGEHISFHPYCLHLWRPQNCEIPRPPDALVGAPSKENGVLLIPIGARA